MNLLFISNFYPPQHLGGYEMLCHEVATHLEARGHQVVVLTSTYGLDANAPPEPGIHRRLKLENDVHYYQPGHVLRYWADKRTNRTALQELLAQVAPDVVVIWGLWNLSRLVAVWTEAARGSRIVYYLSDQWTAEPSAHKVYWDGPATNRLNAWFKRILRLPVRLALHEDWGVYKLRLENAIVCSQAVRDNLVKAGVSVGHAKVIYHGIDPLPYRQAREQHQTTPAAPALRVVFVGTLAPHKGVHTAIESLGHLRKDDPSIAISLTVLGAGHPDYQARLEQLVARWQLADCVTFRRPIPRTQLPAFLVQFDVLVMPSVYEEPQARISQEAMAAGLVLVATLTGGTKEILEHEANGLAFAPEDAQGLAVQLRRLIQDVNLGPRLRQAGWQTVSEGFTISRMIDEFEAHLAAVAVNG